MRASLLLWFLLLAGMGFAQPVNDNSDQIRFITTDLDNFWRAFDNFKKDTTSNPFDSYLKNGTEALKDFAEHRTGDSASFKNFIRKELSYYDSVRASSLATLNFQNQINTYFRNFKAIYSAVSKPDMYLVIGRMNTGGTSCNAGVVIGTELFSDKVYKNTTGGTSLLSEKLPLTAALGIIYFNQKPAHTGYTVLRQCIVQGSADFLATLILGGDRSQIVTQKNYEYGEQHEELLAKQFLIQKNSDDFSNWLYQGTNTEGRPPDLGAWIGYKITEAYYNNSPDKTKAIDEILKINDFEKFLLLSGYLEPFKN
jgi:hypothetical protein